MSCGTQFGVITIECIGHSSDISCFPCTSSQGILPQQPWDLPFLFFSTSNFLFTQEAIHGGENHCHFTALCFDLPYGCSMLQKSVLAIGEGILPVMAIMGESTLSPSKIVNIILHLIFLGTCGHHIWIIFVHFKCIPLL